VRWNGAGDEEQVFPECVLTQDEWQRQHAPETKPSVRDAWMRGR
jgi:hypothetical protein